MAHRIFMISLIIGCTVSGIDSAPAASQVDQHNDPYFIEAQETLRERQAHRKNNRRAKNVILFVADGMDTTTISAARIYDGQSRGEAGEENYLSFERFPHLAMAKTYNTDAQTPDSAGTMSAMVTGVKTKIGLISMQSNTVRGECAGAAKKRAVTIFELAEQIGMATGVVSTARLTHATPAATYAHATDRNWERDTSLPDKAREEGCVDIATQLVDFPFGDGLEVALGGGRQNFLPAEMTDPEYDAVKGGRADKRDLTADWAALSENHHYVWNREGFSEIDPTISPRVLGLFEPSHMKFEADRQKDAAGEPSLTEMTRTAIDILKNDRDGFILVVEAARVDHAHHSGNAYRALKDAQEFSEAIAMATRMTSSRDTLIIVTADHGHTMTFAGYPRKGNDILGLVSNAMDAKGKELTLAADGKPYTTLSYANGPGSVFFRDAENSERPAPSAEAVADFDYRQQATVPMWSETHGGQDVPIYAIGPKAHLFGGTVEQNFVFHVIDDALALRSRAALGRR